MLYYKLDKEIRSEKIIGDIKKLLFQNQKDLSNKILVISIKNITDHTGDNPIPKLTYQK